ncbi:hypothetical protein GobsT_06150 [Gemmata obscuriglobus]|uniref:UPF0235 protein C1280_30155 n=1 Tax=Gemmata obscuriglobus TaxID=114 RepID=A0A2Z3HG96_9BACT|nr:DUF167 domain-containing protein [Gemmata obscuriglobus]AWM40834.1 DUF167 domain-containing protein [Gemmata obscuriglobus]QEG25880.1 hypothetical protein GobsT_06150 [Gemmata obscuriglobus]VTR99918.1 UPF0235 protein HGMM_OP4C819 OS=Candidatus Acetothermus autotrophicum GN=HGMM_OP4C819 PE=3 SV=1: DUF167 [Gemmata obscuriglobus UQM 2246]
MAAAVTAHAEGCTLAVRVQPKAKKNAVLGERASALRVSVTAPPEDGRANDAVLALLCDHFKLQRSQLALLSGQTNRNKVILVRGVTPQQLADLIPASDGDD